MSAQILSGARRQLNQLAESLLVACWFARSLDGVLAGPLAGLLACLLPHLPAFLLAARMADLLACLLPGCHASWLPGFARIGALDAIIVLVGLVFV